MLKLPPPIWAALILTALYLLSEAPPLNALAPLGNGSIGLGLILLGVSLPVIAVTHFRAVGTQVMPTSERNDKLVTTGLYAFTRNPMYLGLVIASLGVAMWFGRPLMYLAPILVFLIANYFFRAVRRGQDAPAIRRDFRRLRRPRAALDLKGTKTNAESSIGARRARVCRRSGGAGFER